MFEIFIGLILGIAAAVGVGMLKYRQWEEICREIRYRATTSNPVLPGYNRPTTLMAIAFAIPSVLGFVLSTFTIVPAGHIGVQQTLGSVNMETLSEGAHFVNPISRIHTVDVRVVKAQLTGANAGTKDLQIVHTDIVVNYRIDGAKAAHIYKEFGLSLEDKILLPAINESFKAVTAHYNSEELITKRDQVSAQIQTELQEKVAPYGLQISTISLVNFGFSPEYQAAIEQKVISTQATLKAEQDLQRIKIEAQQAIAKAEGEAKAIAIQSQAIQSQGGESYVKLKAIEKWDGKLPNVNGGVTPFINVGK
jgi:regulator of protease activity HflC (stomatin/prohibitin superfamily)